MSVFKKYRSKPVKATAVRFTDETKEEVLEELRGHVDGSSEDGRDVLIVTTVHGEEAIVRLGDWVVKDTGTVKDDFTTLQRFYPVTDEVFHERYWVTLRAMVKPDQIFMVGEDYECLSWVEISGVLITKGSLEIQFEDGWEDVHYELNANTYFKKYVPSYKKRNYQFKWLDDNTTLYIGRIGGDEVMPLKPITWRYSDKIVVDEAPQQDGSTKYVIRRSGSYCLNHKGKWEIELQPSSRTKAFLKRCRFDSLKEVESILENSDV